MKTTAMFLSMGLLACVAFSPQTAFAEPDTGPSMSEDNKAFDTFSSVAAYDITQQVVAEGNNITNIAFINTSGRETLVHRSDHTVGNVNVFFNYHGELMTSMMTVNSTGLAAVVEPERRTCASNNVMKEDTYNDLDPSKTAAGLPLVGAAQHAPQMVLLPRPAWKMLRYLRC